MLTLHDAKAIELRDYQTDAVEALRERIRNDQKRLILCAGTGAGKTVMASHLLRQADRKGSYALFLVDRVALVNQTSATLDSYGIKHGVLQGIHPRYSPWDNVQVCSIQTLAKRGECLPRDPDLIIYDECFPGEVEVLTDEGFRRFDALTGAETFAQYDMETSAISFAPASRKVQRPSAGDVYRISADQRVDLTATGGHELIVESKVTGRKKVCVRDFRPGDKIMPVAGYACGPDDVMLAREQFLIAYQADGSMHHELAQEGATVAFTFSKERKINALLEIVERAGFEWREVRSQSNSSPNAQPRRRFMVTVPFVPHKRVWEYFNLSALSARKAAALLTEANRWDGHVQKSRDTNWTYTTTCKQTADFYQSLAVLAGMRATMSCVRDDRSATFSDCYRLHIVSDTDHIGCQRIVPEPVAFDGDVYCVTVPKGCIVVRQNGKVLIVGNCHAQYKSTLDYMAQYPNAIKIGLTATPFTKGMGKHWDGMVNVIPTRRLIEEGHLIQPKMYVAKSPEESELGLTSFGEFSDESAASAGIRIVGDVVAEWVTKTHEFFNGPAKTIVFSPTVEHGRELCAAFAAAGFNFQQVSYLDRSEEERAAKIEEFRRPNSQIHGLVSCGVLTKGFDCFDNATELLTPEGWKGIGEFHKGDAIYGYNRETEKIEIVDVEGYDERPLRDGERMVAIKSQRFDIRTTEGHQFHIKYRDPQTGGSLSKNFLTKTAAEMVDRKSAFAIPLSGECEFPGVALSDDELRLIAWFMTDGCITRSTFSITQSKPFKHEIRALLQRLNMDFRERERQPVATAYANSKPAIEFAIPKGVAGGAMARSGWAKLERYLSKDVSPLLGAMTREQFRVFWDELLKGDGTKQGNKAGWLWCDRKTQADAYTHMAVVRGFSASFSTQITKAGKAMYVVSVRDAQWLKTEPKSDLGASFKFDGAKPNERVWCVKNRLSTVVARRGGKIAIVGNCPDIRIGVSCKPYRKSLSSHMQEIGRVMRPAPGKEIALWLDHAGNLERFALDMFDVWDNGAGELDKAEKRDVEKRERTEITREKVVCPECSGALRGNVCTGCGWEKPARSQITEEEGTLVEFAPNKLSLPARPGLRADCLKDPRKVWIGALNYAMDSTSKGEQAARKWAAGIWYGIYPGQKLPFGWFDMPRQEATIETYSLAEREVRRFRKNNKPSKRKAA